MTALRCAACGVIFRAPPGVSLAACPSCGCQASAPGPSNATAWWIAAAITVLVFVVSYMTSDGGSGRSMRKRELQIDDTKSYKVDDSEWDDL